MRPDLEADMTADDRRPERKISVFGREFSMPRSRAARIAIGVALVVFGIFGFLPILGFWMIPLGLLVLSYEFTWARRLRRRLTVWWHGRRRPAR
jgi:hypothetical protein